MSTARGWRRKTKKQTQDRDETRVIDKIRAKKGEKEKGEQNRRRKSNKADREQATCNNTL